MTWPSLTTWSYWLQLLAAVFGVLTAIFALFAWHVGTLLETEKEAEASKAAATANEQTEKLNKRAEVAESQLSALRQKISPRRLTDEQYGALVRDLRSIEAKGHVQVVAMAGDEEGVAFATQLASALLDGGWQSGLTHRAGPGTATRAGIVVQSRLTAPIWVVALQHALGEAGLHVGVFEGPTSSADAVELVIGNKPQ